MLDNKIPKAEYGIVGGSGTLSSDFPNNIQAQDVEIIADNLRLKLLMVKVLPCGFFL